MTTCRVTAGLMLAATIAACDMGNIATSPTRGASLATEAGHNAADHIKQVNQVSFEVENPCNGEVIVFTGTEVLEATFVDKPENLANGSSVHNQFNSRVDVTGTGPSSGASYSFHDLSTSNFESPSPPAPQFTASFHETARATSSDPSLNFSFKALVHVVLNPGTGEFIVTKDQEGGTCRG